MLYLVVFAKISFSTEYYNKMLLKNGNFTEENIFSYVVI